MAGHSKWAQIKRQKGAADKKRGQVFSKLANAISIAARGGGDPDTNFQLRIAIEQAKKANMPKENIQRAISRASGDSGAEKLEEVLFEAYGPGTNAYLIEAATDNRNRTVSAIRATLSKHGGKLSETGSVSYMFKKTGVIILETNQAEEAELAAIEAGAEDIENVQGQIIVYTDPKTLEQVRQKLTAEGFPPTEVSLEFQPTTTVAITDQAVAKKALALSEALEELDDVIGVSSNFDIPEDLLE